MGHVGGADRASRGSLDGQRGPQLARRRAHFSAALAVELGLEPDATARAEADHLLKRDQN